MADLQKAVTANPYKRGTAVILTTGKKDFAKLNNEANDGDNVQVETDGKTDYTKADSL